MPDPNNPSEIERQLADALARARPVEGGPHVPVVNTECSFQYGPARVATATVMLGDQPHVFLALITPQATIGTFWTRDALRDLSDQLREAATGITVASGPVDGLHLPGEPGMNGRG